MHTHAVAQRQHDLPLLRLVVVVAHLAMLRPALHVRPRLIRSPRMPPRPRTAVAEAIQEVITGVAAVEAVAAAQDGAAVAVAADRSAAGLAVTLMHPPQQMSPLLMPAVEASAVAAVEVEGAVILLRPMVEATEDAEVAVDSVAITLPRVMALLPALLRIAVHLPSATQSSLRAVAAAAVAVVAEAAVAEVEEAERVLVAARHRPMPLHPLMSPRPLWPLPNLQPHRSRRRSHCLRMLLSSFRCNVIALLCSC